MSGVIATVPKLRLTDADGNPLVGGTVTTYLAGTTTLTTTWQDRAMTIANTNPIVLDGLGSCVVWLDSLKTYKIVVKDSLGATIWTQDNIVGNGLDTSFEVSATAIQAALTGAQTSETNAAASLADLKNRYMGAFASDPATRPDGSALTAGCSYFNTTSGLFKVYNGATFQASDINTANLAASTGSSLVGHGATTVKGKFDLLDTTVLRVGVDNYRIGLQYGSLDSTVSGAVLFDGRSSFPNKLGVNNTKPVDEPMTGARSVDASYVAGGASVAAILSGYDNVNNALAGMIASQHGMLYYGADHAGLFAGALNTVKSDAVYSVVIGGASNTIEERGRYAAIIAGDQCKLETGATDAQAGFRGFIASSTGCTVGGRNGTILASQASSVQSTYGTIIGGETVVINELAGTHVTAAGANITAGATASAAYSLIHGETLNVDGDRCLVVGDNHTVGFSYVVATGTRTKAPFIGARVHSSRARGNVIGNSMALDFQCSNETTDTTVTRLSVNGSATFPKQPANSVMHGTAYVTGRNRATGACSCYRIDFVSEQGAAGATPTLRKNTTTTDFDGLGLAGAGSAAPTMQTTTDTIRVQVVGLAATNVDWNSRVVATVTL